MRVELVDRADPRQHWTSFALDTSRHDYVAGARVAELHEVQPRHSYLLVVRILDRQLRTVDGRVSILDMPDGPFAATVVLTRP